MFRTLMLAIVAVLVLQPQDSLARHTAAHRVIEAIRAFEARVDALEAGDADQQALIDDLQVQIDDLQALFDDHHLPFHTVFVTSEVFKGNLGGLTGADATCQALADDPSSIVLSGTYLAWLSDSTGAAPINRFTQSSVPYVLPDGSQVASDFTDLTNGSITNPIDMDETAFTHVTDVGVWTNTQTNGSVNITASGEVCDDWLSGANAPIGLSGSYTATNLFWTSSLVDRCDNERRLYCFQQ